MMSNRSSNSANLNIGVALICFAALTLELSLIRVMDVILAPSTGYMVLTSAMFALGLGGIYLYLFPVKSDQILKRVSFISICFSAMSLLIIPIFNALPFSMNITSENMATQIIAWGCMYVTLIIPFLTIGLILAQVFQSYSSQINKLYFFDLTGAGIACLFFIPLISSYGPGGFVFVASSAGLIASFCFYRPKNIFRFLTPILAIIILFVPLMSDNYIDFKGHANKRNNDVHIEKGRRVLVKWDPVSKLDVFKNVAPNALLFSLDGGQQGSWLQKFFGDINNVKFKDGERSYMGRGSAAHYLLWKKGIRPDVLLIGSSAGGDIRVALAFDAKQVDAVELVGAIVNAERKEFKEYGGAWYSHPKVNAVIGEGRTYLRASNRMYDVIQMFSSHTSSSVESGSGAVQTVYLQTVEAYMEYFQHLTDNGALQINHHIYPRMLTTAAQAWYRLGRKEFWRHALVVEGLHADTLPTMIIKMQPWTKDEVDLVRDYMNRRTGTRIDRPNAHHPSSRVHAKEIFSAAIPVSEGLMNGIEFLIGTYRKKQLPYDIIVTLKSEAGDIIAQSLIDVSSVEDNSFIQASFPSITVNKKQTFTIEIAAPEAEHSNGFSIWLSVDNRPVLNVIPRPYLLNEMVSFNPIDPDDNLIPKELLSDPFPWEEAKRIPWNISPTTDESPYFSMIRKYNKHIQPGHKNVIDRNTAYLLNVRLKNGIPGDWLHLVVTAVVSIFFALIFIVIPLVRTSLKKNKWQGMGKDITYFSCLGLGFIMIEVIFIQLFKKLIGYPTHTFIVVICSMLISAGIGSALSKRFTELVKGRVHLVFIAIILCGMIFVIFYEPFFYLVLGMPLSLRILIATSIIVPLGFFMGMPFPLGILGLSGQNEKAIPWAWAINGFFTVVGGLLAILISITTNFSVVLYCGLACYALAMVMLRPHGEVTG